MATALSEATDRDVKAVQQAHLFAKDGSRINVTVSGGIEMIGPEDDRSPSNVVALLKH